MKSAGHEKESLRDIFRNITDYLDIETLSDLSELSSSEICKILDTGVIQAFKAPFLYEKLGLTPQKIIQGDIDIDCVLESLKGKKGYLPSKYQESAYSKIKTFGYMYDFAEENLAGRDSYGLLRHLQVGDELLSDDDHKGVSVRLLSDAIDYVESLGANYSIENGRMSRLVGNHAALKISNSTKRCLLLKSASPKSLFEVFFNEMIPSLENNFEYQIDQISHSSVSIKSSPMENVLEAMKEIHVGSENLCSYKMGILEYLPTLIGKQFAEIKKTSSIYCGDKYNSYTITYN
jgi:hypothetical protein